MDAVGLNLIFTDNLIAAILQVQLYVGGPGREGHQSQCQQELSHMPVDYCSASAGFVAQHLMARR